MKDSKKGTDRRNFIKNATAVSIAGAAFTSAPLWSNTANTEESEDEVGFKSPPLLTNIDSDKVEIVVVPKGYSTAWIEYGTTSLLGFRSIGAHNGMLPASDRVLRFKLTDLEPGVNYFFRVHLSKITYKNNYAYKQEESIKSELLHFKTLNSEAETATFACWNDTHENEETLLRLLAMLKEQQPDFLLWNGDITNNIFNEEQIIDQFFKHGSQASSLSVPLMLSRGNHDVRGKDARCLESYLAGPGGSYYYGFRQGPLSCIVLDTGEDKPDNHDAYAGLLDFEKFRTEQAQWLERTISEPWFANAPFRIVFTHIPLVWDAEVPEQWPAIWGVEGHKGWICEDGYAKWNDLLVKGKVQLVISGHTHRHAYFPPNKVHPYGQLIGGGPKPEAATCILGDVTGSKLTVKMLGLDGSVLEKLEFIV